MTKAVRIENADNARHAGVLVQVWDCGYGGKPDTLAQEERLPYPTMMTTKTIHANSYLVIKEIDITDKV